MSSSGRSLRSRPVRQAPAPRRQPTARELENREMTRRRRETPVAEANRIFRIIRQLGLEANSYDAAIESYNDQANNINGTHRRLTAASPMRPYYATLIHKLRQGRPHFINQARRRFNRRNNNNMAPINAALRAMATNVSWANLKNMDPISLANARNWPGNLGFAVRRGNHVNYFTVPSFIGYFGKNWKTRQVMSKGHPLTRGPVARGNITVVKFTGNKPR
jgi:hypothetical protein